MADLTVDLGRIQLKNPVMTASGTFGYGMEYDQFFPISKLGAVVVKGIFLWLDGRVSRGVCTCPQRRSAMSWRCRASRCAKRLLSTGRELCSRWAMMPRGSWAWMPSEIRSISRMHERVEIIDFDIGLD